MKAKEIEYNIEAPPLVINYEQSKQPMPLMAQYPSSRSESLDSGSIELNSLYQNGLIFTAFELESRTTKSLRDFRKRNNHAENPTFNKGDTYSFNKESRANILMPRSQTDIDTISHKFSDIEDSMMGKAESIGANVLSNIASTAVFGLVDSATKGIFADRGEQLHTTARSMYQGAENRVKVFSWQLTPRTVHDLIEILKIYDIFSTLSYGDIGKSSFVGEIKKSIDDFYTKTILSPTGLEDQKDRSIITNITSFLSNVITVSNPTVWTIKNFGKGSKFDYREDIFGPAQISNIRFDKSSDGKFRGLSVAPNLPNTFLLEVTFREVIALDRRNFMGDF